MTERKIYALDAESLAGIQSVLRGPSGGGGDGNLEARIAKLEASVGYIQSDVREIKNDLRLLLAALVGAFLILGGMMIFGYLRVSDQIKDLSHPIVSVQYPQQAGTPVQPPKQP